MNFVKANTAEAGTVGRILICGSGCRIVAISMLLICLTPRAYSQMELATFEDITLATDALLMPRSAPYGRSINGVSFQTENITTIGNYQYSTWYRARGSSSEDIMLARRDLTTGSIEIMDTGRDLVNGDSSSSEGSSAWDAHNVISMGISTADGRIHLSYDQHGSQLNFTPSVVGAATGVAWDSSILQTERATLNPRGPDLNGITYPRFIPTPSGGLDMTYRTGSSGNGNLYFATYDAEFGVWSSPQLVITGTNGLPYTDLVNTSSSRNAYLNGVNYDQLGNIHITWTWRENAGGSNHDIMYAYSDDGGLNWKNNDGSVIGGPLAGGSPIDLNSPGIIIDDGDSTNGLLGQLDRSNTLMNQQAQTVDPNGYVHVVMWHKTDDAPAQLSPPFTTAPAAYYHYFRGPDTGDWNRVELPTSREVGSRPDIAYDELGNIYVTYLSPGPGDGAGVLDYYTDGDLIIAGATRASGYTDWRILETDTRDFASEPFIDQNRLSESGILSVFVQENDDADIGRTGTPLHVIEYEASSNLRWTGDAAGVWSEGTASGLDWNSRGEATGNARFYNGYQVKFSDDSAVTQVNVTQAVSPGKVIFDNLATEYTLTGAGIEGNGSLVVRGGGRVILANGANSYAGSTDIQQGTLALSNNTSLSATKEIYVHAGAKFDLAGLGQSFQLGAQQQLYLERGSTVEGDLEANSSSSITGAGNIAGDVIIRSGGHLTVEDPSGPTQGPLVLLADDFNGSGGSLNGMSPDATIDGGTWQAGDTWADNGVAATVVAGSPSGQAAHLDFSPEAGNVYVAEATILNDQPNWIAFGFLPADSPVADWTQTDAAVRHSNAGGIAWGLTRNNSGTDQEGFLGPNTSGAQSWNGDVADPTQPVTWKIVLDTTSEVWTAQWFVSDAAQGVAVPLGSAGNPGIGGIGFSHDRSATANAGGHISEFSLIRLGKLSSTLVVDGDLTLENGAVLEIDIFTPLERDLLDVAGQFELGGTLAVRLIEGAPDPQWGDTFDILDFGAATGSFSSYDLPALAAGLAWDVSNLGSTGALEVVYDLDLDDDGDVDGIDFLILQRTEPGLLPAWQELYGRHIIGTNAPISSVPEPSNLSISVSLFLLSAIFRRQHFGS